MHCWYRGRRVITHTRTTPIFRLHGCFFIEKLLCERIFFWTGCLVRVELVGAAWACTMKTSWLNVFHKFRSLAEQHSTDPHTHTQFVSQQITRHAPSSRFTFPARPPRFRPTVQFFETGGKMHLRWSGKTVTKNRAIWGSSVMRQKPRRMQAHLHPNKIQNRRC